jgi:hypothetical protein
MKALSIYAASRTAPIKRSNGNKNACGSTSSNGSRINAQRRWAAVLGDIITVKLAFKSSCLLTPESLKRQLLDAIDHIFRLVHFCDHFQIRNALTYCHIELVGIDNAREFFAGCLAPVGLA